MLLGGVQVHTDEPPCTPLFIHEAPCFFSSIDIDEACPPTTDSFSRRVTLKRSRWLASVAAQDYYVVRRSHNGYRVTSSSHHASGTTANDDDMPYSVTVTILHLRVWAFFGCKG